MNRNRKLLAAGAIFILGLLLAWPFRKDQGSDQPQKPPLPAGNFEIPDDRVVSSDSDRSIPTTPDSVTAQVASAATVSSNPPANSLTSFDIANHPALGESRSISGEIPSTEGPDQAENPGPVPTYSTATIPTGQPDDWPEELIHIIANGDTLERLAERYLNDPGRAMEIFDLNRDQLSNPHLLPIGIELRIPQDPARILD